MNVEELKLSILKILVEYEQEFCNDIPQWKKELSDPSYIEEMEWLSFGQLNDKLELAIDANYLKDILRSMDGDLIDVDWDETEVNGVIITPNGAVYLKMKGYQGKN